MVELQLDVFKREPILFNKLKKQKFRITEFHKYCRFIDTMNKDDFQWYYLGSIS